MNNNFNISKSNGVGRLKFYLLVLFFIPILTSTGGCGGPSESGTARLKEFEIAGQKYPADKTINAAAKKTVTNSYAVAIGDVLEIRMPMILKDVVSMPHENEPYLCRVNDSGNIPLPIVGEINVVNQSLAEVEQTIAKAYYPQYVLTVPAVVCKVQEHIETRTFTVTGLVREPGVFPYPTNVQYSLIDAIANAGGADLISDPKFAKIYRRSSNGKIVAAIFKIDKNSISKATNVIIKPGDIVSLEPTFQTQTNLFLSQVFRFNIGTYINPSDF